MLVRQKALLYFLWRCGGIASRLQVTKWCFLLRERGSAKALRTFYGFVPYHYGPFSFSLYHEAEGLATTGHLEAPDPRTWKVTSAGIQEAIKVERGLKEDIESVLCTFGKLSLSHLVDTVYRDYPWFTLNSKTPERRAAKRPKALCQVYTVGYEGLLIDEFLNLVLSKGMRRVIDVRSNPIARRYGFHKSTLSRLCGYLDIAYCHFPELGIPSRDRVGLVRRSDYEKLFERYRKTTLPSNTRRIHSISRLMSIEPSVLLCQEADPSLCHRSHLAERIAAQMDAPIRHLGWPR